MIRLPAELVFVIFGVAEGITCTKYSEKYLSLFSEVSVVPLNALLVDPLDPLGILRVREEEVLVDLLDPLGVVRVREGVPEDPLDPLGVLRVREGVHVDLLELLGVQ